MTQNEYKNRLVKNGLIKKDYRLDSFILGRELIYKTTHKKMTQNILSSISQEVGKEIDNSIKNMYIFSTQQDYENAELESPHLVYIENTKLFIYDDNIPNNMIKYTASEKLVENNNVPNYPDGSTGIRTTLFNTTIKSHTFKNGIGTIVFEEDVTEIKKYAFYNNPNLISITIPNTVTVIGKWAFYYCSGLTSVTIPNSVTSIDDYAFYGCSGLTSVTIPNSVISISSSAFRYCSGLTSMTVESGNKVYDSRENCNAIIETLTNKLIAGCQNTIIPNSVTSIGSSAFQSCSSLTSIIIPNSVISIGGEAFSGCSGLTSMTIPNSVTSIGDGAFNGCGGFTSVTIPNSVTSIGIAAFYGCSSLTSVTIESTIPPTIVSNTFDNTTSSIYVPEESVDTYKTATNWSSYADRIQPITQ